MNGMKKADISVSLIDYMGDDISVVNAARVSFNKRSEYEHYIENPTLPEKDVKLINYLGKHNHWTPFAHTSLSFRIKAPIFVARQLGKHQVGGVWNEVSRRYVDTEPELYFPSEWRGRAEDVKQGSSGAVTQLLHTEGREDLWADLDNQWKIPLHVETSVYHSLDMYNRLLQSGVCPEQARMILPQNTMTEWIWTGSLPFFTRVIALRTDPHTQQETQEVAKRLKEEIPRCFEHSLNALIGV
jgi:thymidylate synthase (FAD)